QPLGFVARYDVATEECLNLREMSEDKHLPSYNFTEFEENYRRIDFPDIAIVHKATPPQTNDAQPSFVFLNIESFGSLLTYRDISTSSDGSIFAPPQAKYILINHLEKPYYRKSPPLHFSEGILSEGVTNIRKFAGPTSAIVRHNQIAIKLEGRNADYYLLP